MIEDVLTLNKAAKLAGMPMDEFITVLGAADISVFGYDAGEVQRELDKF